MHDDTARLEGPPLMPTMVDAADDLGAHAEPAAEIWYLTARVHRVRPDERERGVHAGFDLQTIVTTSPSGRLVAMNSLRALDWGEGRVDTVWSTPDDAEIAHGQLRLVGAGVSLSGDPDELRFDVPVGGDGFTVTCRPTRPVLYSAGAGAFEHFAGTTWQYAFPSVAVTGAVRVDDITVEVAGTGWIDRQWSASRDAFGNTWPFTWFGICLDSGESLSVWRARGLDWATVGHPDGSHSIVATDLDTTDGGWRLGIGAFDADLALSFDRLRPDEPFLTGVVEVTGTWRDAAVTGIGFIDEI